ncbi:CCHC-type zinc finger protein CG3800 [Merluccius polli]|uniref:CCHC-type zinc finger protein CG3800 n=1 Tax=Merluccius polli TaxID=89951 RepID=A0AA47MMK1_MERPO|nr:CCHC-type zinc finger protein CG3800 [Merluccius polli]
MAGIVGSIGSYDENVEQWSSYTERFECFVIANKIEDETLVPTFLTVMGPKTYNLLRCLVQPDKPGAKSYEAIVATLATHFSPKPLVIAERFRFHKRNQEEGESVAVFVAALRRLAEHCEFGAVLNDTIRDRLVCGMRCEAAQKRLLTESALTLDKAMEISVSMELAARDAHQLSTGGKLHQVATRDRGAQNKCYRCDRTGHLAAGCWSKDVECRKCGKMGHIERACKSKADKKMGHYDNRQPKQSVKKKQSVHSVKPSHAAEDGNSSSDEATVYVLSVQGGPDGYWVTPLLEEKPVRMEIGTGAAVSLVSYAVYKKKLRHLPLQQTSLTLKTYTGESVPTKGVVHVTVKVNNQTAKLPLYVVTGNFPSLLGRAWLEVLTLGWPAIRQVCKGDSHLTTVLNKHAEVFKEGLGTMKEITVKLNLKRDSRPKFFKARTDAPITYAQAKRDTRNDPVLSKVLDIVLHGGRGDLPELKPYLTRRNELSVQAGCLLWGRRVIVPPELQKKLLQQLHAGHSDNVLARNYGNGPRWIPAAVLAQTGPVSYTVRTSEDIVWRRHVDQLLSGSSAALPVPPVFPAESLERDRLEPPTVTQEVPCAAEPGSSGPVSPAESSSELSPVPNLPSTPATAGVESPGGGGGSRRYPQRARRSPKRLEL